MRTIWPKGGLWRHSDFLKLWSAETISQVGSQVTGLALPLVAIITLDVSAFEVALLGVIEFAPFILISLPAGVWVDRMPRRPILIVGDLGRAALLATIPIAYAVDALTIWQLYVVGFLFGVLTVFFDVAYQSYLPALVEREQLVDGNSKLEISRSGAQLAGPALAGILIQVLKAPLAILLDAISFLVSGLFVLAIRKREAVPDREPGRSPLHGMRAELSEGVRYVFGHRYLRWIAASTATFNFFGSMTGAIFLVYAVRRARSQRRHDRHRLCDRQRRVPRRCDRHKPYLEANRGGTRDRPRGGRWALRRCSCRLLRRARRSRGSSRRGCSSASGSSSTTSRSSASARRSRPSGSRAG